MTLQTSAPAAGAVVRPWRRYCETLATLICARVAKGFSLMEICEDEAMPDRSTVKRWARTRPEFGARLKAAFVAGRGGRPGRRPVWRADVAELICERVAMGMSLDQAVDLPGLPCAVTVYGWLANRPEFCAAYERARMWQAHRRFDQVWEIAEAAQPGTAFVARVKISAAQWQAARLAPWRYGAKGRGAGAVEPRDDDDDDDEVEIVRIRKFGAGPGEPQWKDVPFRRPG